MCLKKKTKKKDFGGGKMKFSSPGCATTVLKLWWRKRRNMKQKRLEAFLIIAVAFASSASRLTFFPIANFLKFMIFLQSVMIDCYWSSWNCCVCNNTSVSVLSLSMPTTVAWWVMVLPSFLLPSFIHSFILLLLLSFFKICCYMDSAASGKLLKNSFQPTFFAIVSTKKAAGRINLFQSRNSISQPQKQKHSKSCSTQAMNECSTHFLSLLLLLLLLFQSFSKPLEQFVSVAAGTSTQSSLQLALARLLSSFQKTHGKQNTGLLLLPLLLLLH
jgi:hypothetical protein